MPGPAASGGELELVIDGQPPMKIKAGETCQIPEGVIRDAKAGDKPFKVLRIYVVKAGSRWLSRRRKAISLASNCRVRAR